MRNEVPAVKNLKTLPSQTRGHLRSAVKQSSKVETPDVYLLSEIVDSRMFHEPIRNQETLFFLFWFFFLLFVHPSVQRCVHHRIKFDAKLNL